MHHLNLRIFSSLAGALLLAGCAGVSSEGTANSEATASTETSASSSEKKPEETRSVASSSSSSERSTDRLGSNSSRDSRESRDSAAEAAATNARLVAQLNEASRELATLRATNARLRSEGSRTSEATSSVRNDPVDEKLAASVRSYSQFKQDLAAFMAEMEKTRSERSSMNAQLKDALNRAEEAKTSVTRLEAEVRKERTARNDAEQTAGKLREQLRAIARAMSTAGLNPDKIASEEPTARLEVNTARLRSGSASETPRKHVVKAGETLQQLAEKYYGDASKWRTLLDANRGFVRLDGKLEEGMELDVPPK